MISLEFVFGLRRTQELFARDHGLPIFIKVPHFRYPAAAAIAPANASEDIYSGTDEQGRPILKTMRGLGPLVQR